MIVLDTHIFLWMNLDPERVPFPILNAIEAEDELGLSAISLWETAMLVQYGRVAIPDKAFLDWIRIALDVAKLRILPITPEIAACSGILDMHGDPADRLIAATAMENGCRLATVDQRLVLLKTLQTVAI